ncbi:hypothetical protein ACI1US_01198 [Leucobacter sp. BZR 635]
MRTRSAAESLATMVCTVSRMIIGGSAGFITMMALPRAAPPTTSRPREVVSVNSSMFARVPGPADFEEIDATISAYFTGVTWEIAATIGIVACPPQVTMFTLFSARCSSRFTAGTTYGPIAAGVRSMSCLLKGASFAAFPRCAPALVASKTTSMSAKPSSAMRPSMPSCVVGMPRRAARASPSEAGSMPTIAPISSVSLRRITLNMRSVPMLPGPIMATRVFVMPLLLPRLPAPSRAR